MTLQHSSRRLARPGVLRSSVPSPSSSITCIQCRLLSTSRPKHGIFDRFFGSSKSRAPSTASNPLLEAYLKAKPKATQPTLQRGDLTKDSIFEGERRDTKAAIESGEQKEPRNKHVMAAALDPAPGSRKNWERKMVIKSVRKRGRLSKTERLQQTERRFLGKSPMIKTSVKKMTKLAHQIAGKTIDDAIVQMRFSKKKAAIDVRKHLEYARDRAITERGMGLGEVEDRKGEEVKIETKDGKRLHITDQTQIYIDQAWVNRGPYGSAGIDYRARGRAYLLREPKTSVSVVLKEEATRVRLHEEREQKRKNRKVWTQLPDRPITAQRQYYCW